MRTLLLCSFILFSLFSRADETPTATTHSPEENLSQSFQREYVYMSSQKAALQKQKTQLQSSFQERIGGAKAKTQSLQKEVVALSAKNDEQHELLMNLEKRKKELQKKGFSLENTYKKAKTSVRDFEQSMRFEATAKPAEIVAPEDLKFDDFEQIIEQAADLLTASTQVETFPGSFLDLNGQLTEGTITRVGRVAAIGTVKDSHFVLGPNGEGLLKALEATSAPTTSSLNVYIFESLNKAAKIQRVAGWTEKLADLSPLLFLGIILLLVAGLFGALIKV
ncbi:hypothetical protein K2X05_10560 [bacterium]|nr:hypothetical protein [bacterium]